MILTKKQKQELEEHDWDLYTSKDGKHNCAWISIAPEDGRIFSEVVKELNLTGEGEDVKLLIVATTED